MRQVQLAIKRLIDIVLCLGVIILAWPFLLVIALLVKFSSPGPVLYVQERVGLWEKVFQMIKFRTMDESSSAESAMVWTAAEEARITPVGRFLRDYGLDELPQVLNILRGEMSIVGPRPPLPAQVEQYAPYQRRMFWMRPGVLSLAAVDGRRSIPVERRIELHVQYVEKWSLRLDVTILWRALFVVLNRQDASETVTHEEVGHCES
jgi:lipopolysaccharide/colanic/teichoic acid biosynthesis glycosyltransferase